MPTELLFGRPTKPLPCVPMATACYLPHAEQRNHYAQYFNAPEALSEQRHTYDQSENGRQKTEGSQTSQCGTAQQHEPQE